MTLAMHLFGPRVPATELQQHWRRYAAPHALLSLARILLLCSMFLPYWHMELQAPQYPKGLHLTAYVNRLDGHVREINGLNHYIGMRPLHEAAAMEKTLAVWGIVAMVLLVEGAAHVHSRWAVLLVLPAVLFPVVFLADMYWWMREFGLNLDPKAPLASSVKPFVPTILGTGIIGQFKTVAQMGWGLWLAWAAAILALASLVAHRMAYKPLLDRALAAQPKAETTCA